MPTPFDIIHAVDLTQGIVTRGSVAHSISRKALRQACAREFQPSLGLPSVLERTDVVDPANYFFFFFFFFFLGGGGGGVDDTEW